MTNSMVAGFYLVDQERTSAVEIIDKLVSENQMENHLSLRG